MMSLRLAPKQLGRITTKRMFTSNEMAYSEKRIIGFSRDEMFTVVANVSNYHSFVPWCRSSTVEKSQGNSQIATLEIGFPPLLEKYKSRVIFIKPTVVHSVVLENDNLFKTLDTTFRFGKGKPDVARSCTLHYDLVFEFESSFHSRIAHLFFDRVVKTMVTAFLKEAEKQYGRPSFPHSEAQVLQYKA